MTGKEIKITDAYTAAAFMLPQTAPADFAVLLFHFSGVQKSVPLILLYCAIINSIHTYL